VITQPGETHTLLAPGSSPDPRQAVQLTAGDGQGPGGTQFAALVGAGGTLPYTGAGILALLGLGMSLLSGGSALRRVH
jgi:hypothetical protein